MSKFVLKLIILVLFGSNTSVCASQYGALINIKAHKYGLDPDILTRVVEIESSGNSAAFNVDGEGFSPDSVSQSMAMLVEINAQPWMVKIRRLSGIGYRRMFFQNIMSAQKYVTALTRRLPKIRLVCSGRCKLTKPGDTLIRKLNVVSTDIGLGQINYRYHGKRLRDQHHWYTWFNPSFNLDYAAKHLAELKKRHGSDAAAVAHYHSRTSKLQKAYLARFNRKWHKSPLVLVVVSDV